MASAPGDPDHLIQLYMSGKPVEEARRIAGIGSSRAYRIIKDAGLTRPPSDATRLAATKSTLDERRARASAANAAVRGVKQSAEHLARRARTREERAVQVGEDENRLADWLRSAGHEVGQQTAVGPYNCDLTVGSVAVEIMGGHWHAYGDHGARLVERSRYILDAGWHLYVVWTVRTHALVPGVLDDLVPFVKIAKSNPPARRQYRVVWGTGQLISAGSAEDDHLALVYARPGRGRRGTAD